ncbi:hypothetical protein [Frigoriglobus tundricola]|uniref:FTP domain-containing protein n=1 Tax=Frigoriglobus tundricola TaxID=2774151 RepID=A0A6M5Z5J2_9BACT|nr:hypothetical protein [Frigoriglobus tundricola]QJX00832.1 hypothetical protein FTUN_8470 [Frigoriglobus tundricola]
MSRSVFSQLIQSVIALLIAFCSGCGGGGDGVTVRGSVTYDGKPVEKGYINFHSKDGKGRSVSGEIDGGKFSVKNVPTGKCRVEVVSTPPSQGPMSMEESVNNAKQKKSEPAKDEVPANAEGNNQVHDIASGTELNLALRPSSSPGPTPSKPASNAPGPIRGKN